MISVLTPTQTIFEGNSASNHVLSGGKVGRKRKNAKRELKPTIESIPAI